MSGLGKFRPMRSFYIAGDQQTEELDKNDYTDSRGFLWFQVNTPFIGVKDVKSTGETQLIERIPPGYPGVLDLGRICTTEKFKFTNSSPTQPCIIMLLKKIED